METFHFFDLPNGVRSIMQPFDSEVGHLAVYINTGSRDEQDDEHGIAHLIEHTAFKGTTHRKAYHILSRIDDVGGDLNAFTTKEHICFHASFLTRYTDRAMELLSDIMLHSTFPVKEIEKEKLVIRDEINAFMDSPAESIFDDFEELIYEGHPIARNILGNPATLDQLSRDHILRFTGRNFTPGGVTIAFVGNIAPKRFNGLVTRYFSEMNGAGPTRKRLPFTAYTPRDLSIQKETYQTHLITGNLAFPENHPKKLTLQLLNNILGGPASSSRLNMALRERNASTYHVESNYQAYTDTGYLIVYMGITNGETEKALSTLWKELDKLRNQPLGSLQLHKAHLQVAGQIALGHESKLNEMLWMGRRYLHEESPEPVSEIIRAVEKIDATALMETAREIFDRDRFSTLIYPAKPDPDE